MFIDDGLLQSSPISNRLETLKFDIFYNLFGTTNPSWISHEANFSKGGYDQFLIKRRLIAEGAVEHGNKDEVFAGSAAERGPMCYK